MEKKSSSEVGKVKIQLLQFPLKSSSVYETARARLDGWADVVIVDVGVGGGGSSKSWGQKMENEEKGNLVFTS